MSKYLETAKEANNTAVALMELINNELGWSEETKPSSGDPFLGQVAECIARLVNYGLRCSPRPVQSTVRLRAVQEAVRGLPVRVSMEQREDKDTGKTYNVLVTKPL